MEPDMEVEDGRICCLRTGSEAALSPENNAIRTPLRHYEDVIADLRPRRCGTSGINIQS